MSRGQNKRRIPVRNRRDFIAYLGAALLPPLAARAQPATQHRIAFVHSAIPAAQLTETAGPFWVRRFFETLRRLGLVEGRNLVVERFSAEGNAGRFAAVAAAVVRRSPDVIVANYNALVDAFKAATKTIPIVAIVADPIKSGLVDGLGRPGGNITGVSVDTGLEFYGKELEVLKEAVPGATTVAFLASRAFWADGGPGSVIRNAGKELGITVVGAFAFDEEVTEPQIRRVFGELPKQHVDAALVSPEGNFLAQRALLVELAGKARLPVLYPYRDYVELGGLMAYAPDLGELAERMADDVQRILMGTKPGDIPIAQPTKIDLIINQKTASSMGLAIPSALLARADEVIE